MHRSQLTPNSLQPFPLLFSFFFAGEKFKDSNQKSNIFAIIYWIWFDFEFEKQSKRNQLSEPETTLSLKYKYFNLNHIFFYPTLFIIPSCPLPLIFCLIFILVFISLLSNLHSFSQFKSFVQCIRFIQYNFIRTSSSFLGHFSILPGVVPGRCKAPFYSIYYFIHYLLFSGLLDILSIICCFIQSSLFLSALFYPLLSVPSYISCFYPAILSISWSYLLFTVLSIIYLSYGPLFYPVFLILFFPVSDTICCLIHYLLYALFPILSIICSFIHYFLLYLLFDNWPILYYFIYYLFIYAMVLVLSGQFYPLLATLSIISSFIQYSSFLSNLNPSLYLPLPSFPSDPTKTNLKFA